MKIDPHSHVPIYLQIVDEVRSSIAAGVYKPGESLPPQRSLALALAVNPNTVQKAFDELERSGLVVSRRGVGMFVAERGTASAQGHAEESLANALRGAVAAGRGANISPARIRDIFESVCRQAFRKTREPQ